MEKRGGVIYLKQPFHPYKKSSIDMAPYQTHLHLWTKFYVRNNLLNFGRGQSIFMASLVKFEHAGHTKFIFSHDDIVMCWWRSTLNTRPPTQLVINIKEVEIMIHYCDIKSEVCGRTTHMYNSMEHSRYIAQRISQIGNFYPQKSEWLRSSVRLFNCLVEISLALTRWF